MPGNFKFLGYGYIQELLVNKVEDLVWGKVINNGDEDIISFKLYDLETAEIYLETDTSPSTLPNGISANFVFKGALPDIGKDWNLRFVVGHEEMWGFQIDDFIEFTIMRYALPGTPVEGALVEVDGYSAISTDDNTPEGNYSISGIEPGNYTMVITKQGYKTISKPITISAYETLRKDYQLIPGVNILPIVLLGGATIMLLALKKR